MGTRSRIGKIDDSGFVKSVYCHWDGYPEGVGKTLTEHYTDESKIDQLISLGDMSVLAENIEPKDKHSFDSAEENVCIFYGRDRGEKRTDAKLESKSSLLRRSKNSDIEYVYIWNGSKWECYRM